ncbi:hypothetical protein GCM10009760_14260 [Kitasatospora kazusensis]|uniref:Uncharacterized protein n=1 Tax=Kitasatospora kazusensis TaxID=407974 RepID=A0ABN2Z1Z1_9ACTN
MAEQDWVAELRRLAALGMDIVQIAEHMRENHDEFRQRSIVILNHYRVAFGLSIPQMQDIGGWYEGGLSAEYLRNEIQL